MFSATFKRRIEKLARDILNDPIRIVQVSAGGVGGRGAGYINIDITWYINEQNRTNEIYLPTSSLPFPQGDAVGEANENVQQHVLVMKEPSMKWTWLTKNIVKFTSVGSVLIFVTKKLNSEELAENLKKQDVALELLHGDMHQVDRNNVIAR